MRVLFSDGRWDVVVEGLSDKPTFEQRPKGEREQARWRTGGTALGTEGLAVLIPEARADMVC